MASEIKAIARQVKDDFALTALLAKVTNPIVHQRILFGLFDAAKSNKNLQQLQSLTQLAKSAPEELQIAILETRRELLLEKARKSP